MRICVLGAGATGGHFAVKLARAGHEVSVVARGAHLEAILRNGLQLIVGAETWRMRIPAISQTARLGPQDLVIMAVKSTALATTSEALEPLVGPDTDVIFPQNGMAWWYPIPADGDRRDHRSAAGLCPCCRVGDADARYAGGDRDQARTRSRALSVWLDGPARSVNAVAKPASARSRWRVSRASNSRHRCPRPKRSRLPFLPRRRSPQRSPTPTARWYRSRSP